MMMSSNGNIFRITGHLCGEFTGYLLRLPWIFLGAPLKINGAPKNIQGNLTALQLHPHNGSTFLHKFWQILGYVVSQLITCDESQTSLVTGCTFLWFPSNGLGAYTKAKDSNRNVGPITQAQIEPSPWFNWVSHHIQLKQHQTMKSDFKNMRYIFYHWYLYISLIVYYIKRNTIKWKIKLSTWSIQTKTPIFTWTGIIIIT